MNKTFKKLPLLLILFSMLLSCNSNPGGPSGEVPIDPPSGPVDPGEDIYNQGHTTIKVEGEVYYQLIPGLYVNEKPGLYQYEFELKFAYNNNIDKLYYNFNGEKPVKNKLCDLAPFKSIKIYENIPEGIEEIPMSAAVDEILDSYNNRTVSYNYINNVQIPMNYAYFNNACVVDILFVKDNQDTEMSLTYLVDKKHEYTIPLVFLSMPFRNWFGSPYYFYNNIKEEAEQRVHLEFFDPITEEYWQRNSKIKLGGGWSKGYPQRTMNLNFKKDEKGNKNEKVDYPIFGERLTCGTGKELSKHIRFRLHNGGNCFEQWSGFNDAIIQRAMFNTNVATTAYRPCLVYLNGEYWGLMSLREHYSDYYIKQNYGVDDDNVTMFEVKGEIIYDDGDESGSTFIKLLKDMLNDSRFYASNQNLVEEAYRDLEDLVDMDSLIDALIPEIYGCNWDYVGNYNNLKMWRAVKTSDKEFEDGRWRFCLHDLDFAFTENKNYLDKNVQYSYNTWPLINRVMRVKTFRQKLIARAEELMESNLSADNLTNITSEMYEEVKPYKKDQGKRWGQPENYYPYWLNYYTYLTSYFKNRTANFVNELKNTINNQYGGY